MTKYEKKSYNILVTKRNTLERRKKEMWREFKELPLKDKVDIIVKIVGMVIAIITAIKHL